MKKRKLELKDICGYLPYDLRVIYIHNQNDFPIKRFLDTELVIKLSESRLLRFPTYEALESALLDELLTLIEKENEQSN